MCDNIYIYTSHSINIDITKLKRPIIKADYIEFEQATTSISAPRRAHRFRTCSQLAAVC